MTRYRPVRSLSWALADVDHVFDLSLVGRLVPFGLSDLMTSTQVLGQLLAKQAAALNVEREVDRLVRNLHRGFPRMFLLQQAGNLLRRPVQLNTTPHFSPHLAIRRY